MKINGNTQVDLSLTNIDYNLNVGTSNVSGVTKKKIIKMKMVSN